MKNIRALFKDKDYLLDEPEVEQLLDYCEQLLDESIEYKFEKEKSKELVLKEIIKEISNSCSEIQKLQEEHERFGYEVPNYKEAVSNLQQYIQKRCQEERIYL